MTTEIDICNKALARLGDKFVSSGDNTVANIDTEDNLEGKLCQLNYDLVRDIVTEDRVWSFALARSIRNANLGTPPEFGFDNTFDKPDNALNIWRVSFQTSNIGATFGGAFAVEGDDWRVEGDQILANTDTIYVEYIRRMNQGS